MISPKPRPPKIHNLLELLKFFPESPDILRATEVAGILELYAVNVRYPNIEMNAISADDADIAYESAIEIPYLIGLYQR